MDSGTEAVAVEEGEVLVTEADEEVEVRSLVLHDPL